MTTGPRKNGDFCWMNMLTPDPAAARDFYSALFGWTYTEMGGMGHGVLVNGREIGGVFDLAGPNTPVGMTPQIGVMVKVANADETGARVNALGGRAMSAFDIMEEGRMAVCFDPNGAQFDVWQSKQGGGTEADSTEHGAPSWYETVTTDVDTAKGFYTELFGWTAEDMPFPGFTYTTFKLDDAFVGGVYAITPEMGAMAPHWDTYFTVTNTDATVLEAQAWGATVAIPPTDIPNVGRHACLVSPQGVLFYIIQYPQ